MEQTTKQFRKRNAILACLRGTNVHPSAEWIYDQVRTEFPDISLGTVYRNLTLFKKQGLVSSLGTVNGVERFDGVTEPHVHFICTHCGKVEDLPKIEVPRELMSQVTKSTGSVVEGCQLSFTGICPACQKTS